MLPFRAALFSGNATAGGGGPGGGGNLRTVVGNGNYTANSSGSSNQAQLVKITTPAGSGSTISAVSAAFLGYTAGTDLKALVFADSAGEPATGSPIATGSVVSPATTASLVAVSLPFASPVSLSASTSYWIGFVPSGTVGPVDSGSFTGNAAGRSQSINYSAPAWDNTLDTTTFNTAIWGVIEQGTTLTGLHQQGSSGLFQGNSSMRGMLPPHAIGDTVIIQFGQWFGTLPTISGWTNFSDEGFDSGTRHVLFERTIDGTEDGTWSFISPSANSRTAVATVLRGGGTREGTATNLGSGTSLTTGAVTTSGANRRVFNFAVSGEAGGGSTNTESADGWTDVYSYGTTFGNDYTHSLSYKDQASAGSAGTETRAISNGFWQTTSFAIPDS